MKNEIILFPIIEKFHNKIINKDFIIDKTNVKCVELICEKMELSPKQPILDFGIKKTNITYCEKELSWYNSKCLNITDYVDDVKIWNNVCDKNKNINSNYGWCIYSKENYYQFENCINELIKNKDSRRAIMIYLRPSMWLEYNYNGMNDFICTISVQLFIRENKLIYIVNMRSNDFYLGLFNDFYWHCIVYKRIYEELKKIYKEMEYGNIIWIANSLHVYERHFELTKKIIENFK